ncbi:hypothetical protein [Candidatus Rhabdochlamydia sp. T3358]|uniref:hypothetical protein n=1 Tax=Candidatus Rhabdochlamydia sp. T3358 TaxID=2099795 RepID=UPI0010B12E73|nr:hypothetical protein [Candidatus Rhabdochlamydia sp. T3358]VHO05314.1 hypothetical protein RHT_01712 [Candidatus Rhabdochlamydia sp. T3358]
MSITSLNHLSDFYQQPLPPIEAEQPESIVSQKTIHQWCVNEYVVYLINQDDCLWYITTDQNQKEIQTGKISTSGTRTLDEEIARLMQSRVLINEDGTANFLLIYHTWRIPNRELDEPKKAVHSPENNFIKSFSNYHSWKYDPTAELSLNQGNESIVWNIFRRFSKKDSYFYSLQETTVPSSRCHPGTVALIDKIKKEAFNNPQHVRCLIRDFKVRVVNSEFIKKEYEAIKKDLKEYEKSLFHYEKTVDAKNKPTFRGRRRELLLIFQKCEKSFNTVNNSQVSCITDLKNLKKNYEELSTALEKCKESLELAKLSLETTGTVLAGVGIFGIGAPAAYLAREAVNVGANAVKNYLGNGVMGSLAGNCMKILSRSTIVFAGAVAVTAVAWPFLHEEFQLDTDKLNALQKRMTPLFLQKPLLIEIEPISLPSEIDPRMRVSKFTWAVTVVTNGGSTKDHSEIIIEGINDGFYNHESPLLGKHAKPVKEGEKFIHLAHFLPRIESGLLSPKDLEYQTRTEIWMITSDKVQEMLRRIEKEQSLPKEERTRNFNIRGKYAIFPIWDPREEAVFNRGETGDNCYTWDADHLKLLGIDLGSSWKDYIAAMATNYTKKPEEYKKIPVQEMI